MKSGKAEEFEFLGWDSSKRKAKTTDTGSGGILSTTDPSWKDSERGDLVWLEYLNSNGDRYRAKIHCETVVSELIHPWIETEHNGANKNVPGILVKDWAGKVWTVDVMDRIGKGPLSFNLTEGVLPNH